MSTIQMSGKSPLRNRYQCNNSVLHIYDHKLDSSHLHNMPPYKKQYHHWLERYCPPDICLPLVYDALWHPNKAVQRIAILHMNPTELNFIREVHRQRHRVDLALQQQLFRPNPRTGYW